MRDDRICINLKPGRVVQRTTDAAGEVWLTVLFDEPHSLTYDYGEAYRGQIARVRDGS